MADHSEALNLKVNPLLRGKVEQISTATGVSISDVYGMLLLDGIARLGGTPIARKMGQRKSNPNDTRIGDPRVT